MRPILLAAVLCLASTIAGAGSPDVYIFDVLRRPNYRAAYVRMLQGQRSLPKWMATPEAAGAGTTNAGTVANVGTEQMEVFEFCEPHNCGGHHTVVGFEHYGDIAKGVLRVDGRTRFFGNPSPAEIKALVSELPED